MLYKAENFLRPHICRGSQSAALVYEIKLNGLESTVRPLLRQQKVD